MLKYISVIFLVCLSLLYQTPVYSQGKEDFSIEKIEQGVNADDIYNHFKGMDRSYDGPLPWENDTKFIKRITKYNATIKMAAYKATLHDPLPGEGFNIRLAARQLAGTVVQPGKIFSQNNTIGPYTSYKGYQTGPTYAGCNVTRTVGGGVCKIASLLYNIATLSDLKVIMRSPHSMTVPYVPPRAGCHCLLWCERFPFY